MIRKLDPLTLARMKRQLRCPDCDSTVTIDQSTRPATGSVAHDDTCPALAALERQGRAHAQLAIIRGPQESTADYAAAIAKAAGILAEGTGRVVRVATTPYADIDHEAERR